MFFYKHCHQRQHTISCNVTNIGGTVDQKVWKRSVLELAKRLLEKLSVVSGCEKVFDKGYDIRERATSCDFYFDPSVYLEPADRREDKTLKLKEMILILEESSIFSFSLDLVWTKVLPLTCKALIDTHMCHSAVLNQTGTNYWYTTHVSTTRNWMRVANLSGCAKILALQRWSN